MVAITETRLNFLWLGPIHSGLIAELMKFFKEKSREQELTGTEVARKIAKESGRGLKKGREMILNNAVKSSESRRK